MEDILARITTVLEGIQTTQSQLLEQTKKSPAIAKDFLQPYDENNENFDCYLQRLDNHLKLKGAVNSTEEGDKLCVQILIGCLSPKIYQILTKLTAPQLPNSKTYVELIKLLKDHLSPQASIIAEQHKFTLRLQHEGESIANYIAELKKMTINCDFTCTQCKASTINTHLRSQFIRGLHDGDIREKLLQQKATATFEDMVHIAISIETAKKESLQMQTNNHNINALNRVQTTSDKHRKESEAKHNNSKRKYRDLWGKCFRCGNPNHKADVCNSKNLRCRKCQKVGHLEKVCLQVSTQANTKEVRNQRSVEIEQDDEYLINQLLPINSVSIAKMMLPVRIENVPCSMELDTGAAVSTMSLKQFRNVCPNKALESTNIKLKTYTGEIIRPIGCSEVKITYENQQVSGNLYILSKDVDAIVGREWLRRVKLNWDNIHQLGIQDSIDYAVLEKLLETYNDVLTPKVGEIPNYHYELKLSDARSNPIFMRPRPVAYALKAKVEEEIDRLESLGIIERITHSQWGTPIVPVVKRDGRLRLCADYKATINKYLQDDRYPIPKIEDIFNRMNGGNYFCTLDIHQAYLHMTVDEESAKMLAISTHKGVYEVRRLMFGVKVAPNAWQRFMDQLLQDLEGVVCFFDDIAIQGKTPDELLNRLKMVLDRLRQWGLHLNKEKCQFFKKSITYLGHMIDGKGLHTTTDKVEAITNSRKPKNVSELRTFLGLVNYYQKFLPNLASKLNPLYKLLKKNTRFSWSKECEEAFNQLKTDITSTAVLTPFNENLSLILATDASPTGVGAVLSHITEDGAERPIAFASRSLSAAEKNYSQIDREATAIYWGIKKFFQYCYGRKFTLITDNKPLAAIYHPHKDLPATSAVRLLHYANYLSGFNYDIQYRRTNLHGNADYLSRVPLQTIKNSIDENEVFQIHQIEQLPVTRDQIAKETLRDPEMKKLLLAVQNGNELPDKRNLAEFGIQDNCLLKGIRVAIPTTLRKEILKELHQAHTGINKMKALARSYVWWPRIDQDIEHMVQNCINCCKIRNNPVKVYHPWEYASRPWERVHIDYAGPFHNTNLLILVDSFTKWLEVIPTESISSTKTIQILRDIFARVGLPSTVVTDNGTNFKSNEFENFLKSNGIHHKCTAPYHPATNGQAERYVQTVKQGIRAMNGEPGNLHQKICRFLMQYRKTPNITTGKSPSQLMFNREIMTRIDLVRKDFKSDMAAKLNSDKYKGKDLTVGGKVQVRNYLNKSQKWDFGTILNKTGTLHYDILVDGKIQRKHADQLISYKGITIPARVKPDQVADVEIEPNTISLPQQPEETSSSARDAATRMEEVPVLAALPSPCPQSPLRRSTRIRKKPERLDL